MESGGGTVCAGQLEEPLRGVDMTKIHFYICEILTKRLILFFWGGGLIFFFKATFTLKITFSRKGDFLFIVRLVFV